MFDYENILTLNFVLTAYVLLPRNKQSNYDCIGEKIKLEQEYNQEKDQANKKYILPKLYSE